MGRTASGGRTLPSMEISPPASCTLHTAHTKSQVSGQDTLTCRNVTAVQQAGYSIQIPAILISSQWSGVYLYLGGWSAELPLFLVELNLCVSSGWSAEVYAYLLVPVESGVCVVRCVPTS